MDAGEGSRWRQPDVSSLARGRGKLGPGPLHNVFLRDAGPTRDLEDPGVSCCGLRVVSVDGSVTDVPDSPANDQYFDRPSNQTRDSAFALVRWVVAAESGIGSLLGAAIAFSAMTPLLIATTHTSRSRYISCRFACIACRSGLGIREERPSRTVT